MPAVLPTDTMQLQEQAREDSITLAAQLEIRRGELEAYLTMPENAKQQLRDRLDNEEPDLAGAKQSYRDRAANLKATLEGQGGQVKARTREVAVARARVQTVQGQLVEAKSGLLQAHQAEKNAKAVEEAFRQAAL